MTTNSVASSGGSFRDTPPQHIDGGARTWIVRGANFVVAHSEVDARAEIERESADEYLLLVPDGLTVAVTTGQENLETTGPSLVVVPPGRSSVSPRSSGSLSRVFSGLAEDLAALAWNASSYARTSDAVAPLVPWPDPVGGYRLRCYRLDEFREEPGIVGRIFRCTNLMVNVFAPWTAPRDPKKMTPHSHADFEQCSLTLAGDFVHHLRYPWGADLTDWREDEHLRVESPAAVVFPPTVIHTSQSVGEAVDWRIIDIFAPPRADFSLEPGFVRNADEYPMPS